MRDLLRKKNYTKKDVKKVKKLYQENFEKLKESVDVNPKKHEQYSKKEKLLDALSTKIVEAVENRTLGTVCSLSANLDCFECSGYYIRNVNRGRRRGCTHTKGGTQQYLQVDKDHPDAIHCAIHKHLKEHQFNT